MAPSSWTEFGWTGEILAADPQATTAPPAVTGAITHLAGGLRLISHDHPEFEAHVSSTYPLIANHELYPKARKFMAVLHHEGTVDAKAYRVLWVVQQSPDRQRVISATYIRKHCMLSNSVLNVKPGNKRLVSLFFNYCTSDYNFRPQTSGLQVLEHLHFPFLDSEVISVSIDAVIYSGPAIAGPDAHNLRSLYLATRAAEHDEGFRLHWKMNKMKAALGPGESLAPSQIASILDKDIQYNLAFYGDTPSAMYRRARAQEASIMKGVLTSGGLARFESHVARRVSYRGERLQSIG